MYRNVTRDKLRHFLNFDTFTQKYAIKLLKVKLDKELHNICYYTDMYIHIYDTSVDFCDEIVGL